MDMHVCLLDIDECILKTDGCEQACQNSPGNFSCLCLKGYVLSDNGKNCTGKICWLQLLVN